MADANVMEYSGVPCCPALTTTPACDVLDHHYRLIHNTTVVINDQRHVVPVEVTIHTRLERCPGPLALGDLLYTNTLLPGEKVRLFTQDRRSRFTFDSSSKVSYRNEQTSEEQFYMASLDDFMSDVSVRDDARSGNQSHGSAQGHGGTSGAIQSFFGGASVDVSGSYDASSTSTFLRELSEHAQASHNRAEMGTRTANSTSVGEVQSRTHTEGESEDHFESASREFANPNKCHAITFYFYRINKTQTVKFTIESIERRVIDPAADTRVTNNRFLSLGDVSAIPNGVLATDKGRLEVEDIGRRSAAAQEQAASVGAGGLQVGAAAQLAALRFQPFPILAPIPVAIRAQALAQVADELVKAGLVGKNGQVTPGTREMFSFEVQSSLPTPGVLVKGCLDDCDICEPNLEKEIALDLERKKLENELLKRQIELLDKSQEYRCCPADADETP